MQQKQKILEYHAVFEPAEEGGFNVHFPAFPGCVTFGRTFEESQKMAEEILGLWIEMLVEKGEPLPETHGLSFVQSIMTRLPKKIIRTSRYASAHR